jgi:ATP-dependent Zn protease
LCLLRQAVAEWGLSTAVGPLNIAALGSSGDQVLLRDNSGQLAGLVEVEVRALVEGALEVAMEVVSTNRSEP